jgi:hypothetical protein
MLYNACLHIIPAKQGQPMQHHIFLRHAHALPPCQVKKYKQILEKMMPKDERKLSRSAVATFAESPFSPDKQVQQTNKID